MIFQLQFQSPDVTYIDLYANKLLVNHYRTVSILISVSRSKQIDIYSFFFKTIHNNLTFARPSNDFYRNIKYWKYR